MRASAISTLWFVLTTLPASACTRRAATEIVLRLDSDIGAPLQSVRVQVDRGSGANRFWDVSYSLRSGSYALPGTLALAPRSPTDPSPISVRVVAEFADPAQNFDQRAIVTFVEGRTLLLEMYLASACEDAAVRARCETHGQTCSVGGQCIDVTRPSLPDANADVHEISLDAADTTDSPDGWAEAGSDALRDVADDGLANDAAVDANVSPDSLRGSVTGTGAIQTNGSMRLVGGIESISRSCVSGICISGGITP